MNKNIKSKLELLRSEMKAEGLSAWLINGADPHLSEDAPDRWLTRKFIANFSGSYGWLAITHNEAVLWTDSRYYLQAENELADTGIEMLKARLPETIPVEIWVSERLKQGDRVGFDGTCYATAEVLRFREAFIQAGISLQVDTDLLDRIWTDRPGFPVAKAFDYPIEWAGWDRREKISRISHEVEKTGAGFTVVSALDDLCWTFNILGNDIAYNPVVMGFGLIGKNRAQLFVDPQKMDPQLREELKTDGVEIKPYSDFYPSLEKISGETILLDPDRSNFRVYDALEKCNKVVFGLSNSALLKSRKNDSEIRGMKKAQVMDGLALLDFQLWLEATLGKEPITEYDVSLKLAEFRSKRHGFRGESFPPIVGYKDHGAIVHLRMQRDIAYALKKEGALLFDSGGQYEFGTTDITRTLALGPVSPQLKTDFTLALKGMIALSKIRFPRGTLGCHLDVLARKAMWENGITYGHGTGHGVGAFLNVHEGPMSIRLDRNDQTICPGNILSNEPGIYRTGEYGVRTENMMLCVEDISNEFGDFLRFETLTRYPIDTRLIDRNLLESSEIEWINTFHQSVLTALSPYTSSEEFKLLRRLTAPID